MRVTSPTFVPLPRHNSLYFHKTLIFLILSRVLRENRLGKLSAIAESETRSEQRTDRG